MKQVQLVLALTIVVHRFLVLSGVPLLGFGTVRVLATAWLAAEVRCEN